MPDSKEPIDLSDVVDALRPYLPGMVETIGLAGAAVDDPESKDGEGNPKRKPGDIRAASIGLELVSKYLTGRGSDRASRLLKELEASRASERDAAASGPRIDFTDKQ